MFRPAFRRGFFVAFPQVLVVKTQLLSLAILLYLSNEIKC